MDEIPIGFGHFEWIAAPETCRVIDQPIQRAEPVFHFMKHPADIVYLFEIGVEQLRRAAFFGSGASLFLGSAVMNRHPITRAIQPQCNSAADALSSSGHQYGLRTFRRHHTTGSPCTPISSASTPALAGSGRRPVQLAHSQKNAVLELSTPEMAPIVRGLHEVEAIPAPIIDSIIIDQFIVSMVANTRPRNSSGMCCSSCDM